MRTTFSDSPILADLILIRGASSAAAVRLGAEEMEKSIATLVEAGLSPENAFDTYSAVAHHVRGTVVLERLQQKSREPRDGTLDRVIDHKANGHRPAAADETKFEYGLNCILDHAARLIKDGPKTAPRRTRKSAR